MNRKSLFLITFCILNGAVTALGQVFKNANLQISQLENQVWVVETNDMTTMYIIEGDDKALLIDTGTKCEALDEVIHEITKKPLYVLITHVHPDHAGNIGFFDEIYIHPADTVLMQKSYKGKVHFINDGDVFDLGGKQIEISHMPGHTPGSIVLLDRQAGCCYSGDAFGSGVVWMQLRPFSPMVTYINSCIKMEKLMNEGITKIYCGHYPYLKRALGKDYVIKMKQIAMDINNGTATDPKPYLIKVSISCENPMVVMDEDVGIVYDPEHVK